MYRTMFALISVIGTTLMGMGVTGVLAAGLPGWQPIALAAAIGFTLSLPVSWLVARRIVGADAA